MNSYISSYLPIDFSNVKEVTLVGYEDKEYLKWEKNIFKTKKTDSQKRRKKEIQEHSEFFEELKKLWFSDGFEKEQLSKHCCNCHWIFDDKYDKNIKRCWQLNKKLGYNRKPDMVSPLSYCTQFLPKNYTTHNKKEAWVLSKLQIPSNIRICGGNLYYYLYDLGFGKKPKNSLKKAKENEKRFIKNIQEVVDIIPKFFKILDKNGETNFKFPDVLFNNTKQENIGIIEYKSDGSTNFIQILDYHTLYKLATKNKEEIELFWVVPYCWGDKKQKSEDIKIFTEEEFIDYIDNDGGLDAWM